MVKVEGLEAVRDWQAERRRLEPSNFGQMLDVLFETLAFKEDEFINFLNAVSDRMRSPECVGRPLPSAWTNVFFSAANESREILCSRRGIEGQFCRDSSGTDKGCIRIEQNGDDLIVLVNEPGMLAFQSRFRIGFCKNGNRDGETVSFESVFGGNSFFVRIPGGWAERTFIVLERLRACLESL